MADSTAGLPTDLVSADISAGHVSLVVEESVYPLEAVYGASYTFIDRCYVHISRPSAATFQVRLSPKKMNVDEDLLRTFIGEFGNELLSCAWRLKIAEQNRALIESVTMQAVGSAMGQASLDDLAAFDFTDEAFEDPLGIAVSWEEKYKKKEKTSEASVAPVDEHAPVVESPK